ncbi:hypothetical protein RHS01_04651 [Rhizoctonia solani]|uniref:Uncharacterized protein n=1 Tax=Rhizoctonia solani TaxID=456999 RepID=A0A8H7IC49_9AGAM|nr:hypothetical protein RHS01_04651 [Rhizoctonia solani]
MGPGPSCFFHVHEEEAKDLQVQGELPLIEADPGQHTRQPLFGLQAYFAFEGVWVIHFYSGGAGGSAGVMTGAGGGPWAVGAGPEGRTRMGLALGAALGVSLTAGVFVLLGMGTPGRLELGKPILDNIDCLQDILNVGSNLLANFGLFQEGPLNAVDLGLEPPEKADDPLE